MCITGTLISYRQPAMSGAGGFNLLPAPCVNPPPRILGIQLSPQRVTQLHPLISVALRRSNGKIAPGMVFKR